MTISCICRIAPLKGRNTKVCMWGEVPDVITPVKFNIDRFRVSDFWGSKNRGVPLTRRVALTTVLINVCYLSTFLVNWHRGFSLRPKLCVHSFIHWTLQCKSLIIYHTWETANIISLWPLWCPCAPLLWKSGKHSPLYCIYGFAYVFPSQW